MKTARFRAIPSVDKILQTLGDTGLPAPVVVHAVRRHLQALRSQKAVPNPDAIVASIRSSLEQLRASRITPVINATGVLVHTNLGRAPLAAESIQALTSVGANYSTLEYSLTDGTRGGRAPYLEHALAILCGAEAATVVNNNAAALVLLLEYFCGSGSSRTLRKTPEASEVIISRGELLQIGGGFRIPEILEARGARLREIGTTNQTSVSDYAKAISRNTALILKVHRSNFFMDGFVDSPSTEELATLARKKRVPFVEDLGSGAMVPTETAGGVEHEPTPAEVLRHGVDLVCFSGDKLFGGPQAGIIAGRKKMVEALKREPLFRALRCDKLILSGLESTIDAYLRGESRVPVLEMMRAGIDELKARAERIVAAVNEGSLRLRVATARAHVGGGTLPRSVLPSIAIEVTHPQLGAQALATLLRRLPEPVIGYVGRGSLKLDLRTVFPHQDEAVIRALRTLGTPGIPGTPGTLA
ncbi:MAG TPA: L-seryl-tRNA(Sec) selenium transferase [Vicinamibacterales bacterium]|nr:L-seryl-tRNA(Sec) selenium transferase [Vicinamibacterales bacterium]